MVIKRVDGPIDPTATRVHLEIDGQSRWFVATDRIDDAGRDVFAEESDENAARCPQCQHSMQYVREVPFTEAEMRPTATGFSMPLASALWRCPTHGVVRVFISGAAVVLGPGAI